MLDQWILSGFADEIDTDIFKQINLLKGLGQTCIELRSANDKNIADYTIDEARELKRVLNEAGMKVSAIGSPIGKISIKDDFADHFAKYQHVVELAKIFDTPYIRMFSFYIPEGEEVELYEQEVMDRMKEMIDYAVESNVVLLHENEKGIYGAKATECFKLMEVFYGEHFKAVFDFANFIQVNQNPLEAYQRLEKYIAYVHVKDALLQNGMVVPPGEGDGQLKTIFQLLRNNGYCGYISLEPHLAEFTGFSSLEKHGAINKKMTGEEAYALAYNSFMKIMEEIK